MMRRNIRLLIKRKIRMKILSKKSLPIKEATLETLLTKINQGGITYDVLQDKDYAGTPYISISPFPERSETFLGKVTKKIVQDYCIKNSDLLLQRFVLGAWFDKNSAKTYLDISAPIPLNKKSKALALGKKANQIAGFNLSNFSDIPIGGTGEFDVKIVSFKKRLREALTLMVKTSSKN